MDKDWKGTKWKDFSKFIDKEERKKLHKKENFSFWNRLKYLFTGKI